MRHKSSTELIYKRKINKKRKKEKKEIQAGYIVSNIWEHFQLLICTDLDFREDRLILEIPPKVGIFREGDSFG